VEVLELIIRNLEKKRLTLKVVSSSRKDGIFEDRHTNYKKNLPRNFLYASSLNYKLCDITWLIFIIILLNIIIKSFLDKLFFI